MAKAEVGYRPEAPQELRETGVTEKTMEGLILKYLKQDGILDINQFTDRLKISSSVIQPLLKSLTDRKLIWSPRASVYDLTELGREYTRQVEREDAYIGPAPVTFREYCNMVIRQSKLERRVSLEEVREAFKGLEMTDEMLLILKEGFNSQRCMLFYGPPGNGKSMVTGRLHKLINFNVLIPYAFEFNGKVVEVYDPAYHEIIEEGGEGRVKVVPGQVMQAFLKKDYDRRWVVCHPPLVIVGTEFRVEHFEISFDGKYTAPPQVKANNGIFVFDDLGRQTQDHNMILNQFIYPLETQESIVKFGGGSSFRAPYHQRLFLSTNLNKDDIIDDAFNRRLLYQVLVDRPSDEMFKQIWINTARSFGSQDEGFNRRYADMLLQWYKRDHRVIRACDPRNIHIMIDASLEEGQKLSEVMSDELFERVYNQYPAAYEEDAKVY